MPELSVAITLGGGVSLGITSDDRLVLKADDRSGVFFDIGKATDHRFNQLQSHIGRLRAHAVEN